MCQAIAYKSTDCPPKCKWLHITNPCHPGAGFTTHSHHVYTAPRGPLGGTKYHAAALRSCPNCHLRGGYDGNKVRLVARRWGGGVGRFVRDCVLGPGLGVGLVPAAGSGYPAISGYGYEYGYGYGSGMGYHGGLPMLGQYGPNSFVPVPLPVGAVSGYYGYGVGNGGQGQPVVLPNVPHARQIGWYS